MRPIASYFRRKKLNREAFLYAMAKNPRSSKPLDDTEKRSITAWVNGRATPSEIHLAKSSVRNNLDAKNFLLSLELENAAGKSSAIPYHVTRAIMRHSNPVSQRRYIELPRLPQFENWQYAAAGAVVAVAIVSIINVNGIFNPRSGTSQSNISGTSSRVFQVAVLTDRTLLNDQANVVRGLPSYDDTRMRSGASAPVMDFTEFDVSTQILRNLFMAGSQSDNLSARDALDSFFKALPVFEQNGRPRLIFDRELQAKFEAGISTNFITLRAYDLESADNTPLARAIGVTRATRAFFITYAP